MSITSADPGRLASYLQAASGPTGQLCSDSEGVLGATRAFLSSGSAWGGSLGGVVALGNLLDEMAANDDFLNAVLEAVVAADREGVAGPVAVTDSMIAGRLSADGVPADSGYLTVDPDTLFGQPPSSGFSDDPVCALTGNFVHAEVDLAFPARSAVLNLGRWYNSLAAGRVGVFGAGWSSLLDVALAVSDDRVSAYLADGAVIGFSRRGETWLGNARPGLCLTGSTQSGFLLTEASVRHRFDGEGVLHGSSSGRGEVVVERDGTGAIVALAERLSGRRVEVAWSGARVVSLLASDGRRCSYRYSGAELVQTSLPAGDMAYRMAEGRIAAVVDADGVVVVANSYDSAGRVVSQTSRFGRVSTYHYGARGLTTVTGDDELRNVFIHDARANLTALVDSAGRVLRLRYDDEGRLAGYTDRRGETWSIDWDPASGKPARRVGPEASEESWVFDDEGRTLSCVTPAGITTWKYPGPGFLTPSELVEPGGVATRIEVSEDDLAAAITDADGVRVALAYDADGQLVALTDALGNTTRLSYDEAGYLLSWRMPSSKTVSFRNDVGGRVVSAVSPAGRWSYELSPAGRAMAGVDPVEGPWEAGYGSHGEVCTVVGAARAGVAFGYDTHGNRVSVTGPDGRSYGADFDGLGQLIGLVDPAGERWRYEWSPEGDLEATLDPAGRRRRREVDALGRTVAETDGEGRQWRRSYRADGRLGSIMDPMGVVTDYRYDDTGRVVSVSEDGVELGAFTWSAAGRLVERRGPGGTVGYRWNDAGQLVGVGDDSGSVSLVLDVDSRVMRAVDERGRVVSVSRDGAGRVVAVTDRRGIVRSVDLDGAGRVAGAAVGSSSSSFSYDRAGQLASATDPLGAAVSFSHDVAGRLASVTDPLGATTRYGYDLAGRVAELVEPGGDVSRLQRDRSGEVVGLEFAGGGGWERFLDGSGLAVGYGEQGAGSPSVPVRRDGAGRVVGLPRPGQLAAQPSVRARPELPLDASGRVSASPSGEVFRHDLAGQLVEWLAPGRAPARYRYDRGGRLVGEEEPSGRRRYRYDSVGRLASVTEASGVTNFGYDPAGRRVSASGPGGDASYRWDAAGRLVGVEAPEGSVAISLDNLGLPSTVGDVEVVWELSAGWPRVARIGEVSYEWVGSGPDAGLAATGPDGVARDVPLDWMGSAGEVDDPWGASAEGGVRIGYRGQLCIGGLVWLGARVYDPATRSFLSPDPLPNPPGAPCGANRYQYAWNDPVSLVDPMGLRPLTQAEFEAAKHKEGLGRLGQAWQAASKDPWGSLALGLTVVAGIALCFTPAAAIGAGILIGVGMSAGVGIATGTFDPRVAAFQGMVGGITGGAGAAVGGMGIGAQVAVGTATGASASAAGQEVFTHHVDWGQVAVSGAIGGAAGGLGPYLGSKIQGWQGGRDLNSGVSDPGLSERGLTPAPGTRIRPEGIPEDWRTLGTKSAGGTRYFDPSNPGNAVRVMQGEAASPYPNSQTPYVRWQRNGQPLDALGNVLSTKQNPDAHIPLQDFTFMPELFK